MAKLGQRFGKYSQEQINEIILLIKSGRRVRDISVAFDIPGQTIYGWIHLEQDRERKQNLNAKLKLEITLTKTLKGAF